MEIAIYLGKWKSCVVMKDNGKIVKEIHREDKRPRLWEEMGD
jgi:hypothetical protein